MPKSGKEIERRFLLDRMPEDSFLFLGEKLYYDTVYVYTGDPELRVRERTDRAGVSYTMAVKFGEGLIRDEFLTKVTREIFKKCKAAHPFTIIEKIRHRIAVGELVWEIDCFLGRYECLYLAEVELISPEQLIEIPIWLKVAKEVTDDRRYDNKNLAVHGYPNPK